MSQLQFGFASHDLRDRVVQLLWRLNSAIFERYLVGAINDLGTRVGGRPLDSLLTPAELRVLFAIVRHVDPFGRCVVSINEIGRQIGRTDRHNIRRVRDSLVAKGVVEIIPTPAIRGGDVRTTCYVALPNVTARFRRPTVQNGRLPRALEIATLICRGEIHSATLSIPQDETSAHLLARLGFKVTINKDTGIALVERPEDC